MRLTRQDSNDSHHRRKGEGVIKKEDIKEQEPNEKTRLTMTSMTSSIIDHISICAISQFSLGNEGKDSNNLNSQTWPGSPRRPSSRHPLPPDPDLAWKSQTSFSQTSATTRVLSPELRL